MENTLKDRMKALRLKNNYTESFIANYLGTTQAVVWKYESGKTEKIPAEVIRKLCQLYAVSADYLLGLPKGLSYPEKEQ